MPLHLSIPVGNTMEPISGMLISPLISKCKIKVCYVGDEPNRNHTVIKKEVAEEMGRKLPGSPIVGYFNKDTGDFDEHSRDLVVENGEYRLIDITKPYGFIPTDATVGFEKYIDEGGIEHQYMVTEGYIWTEAYPESKRIIERGNNQSMELTKDQGFWTEIDNSSYGVFIYNEALIEKLCILGENIEPCFEGSQITAFSLSPDYLEFKTKLFSMISELQETLNEGGSQTMGEENKVLDNQTQETNPNPENFSKNNDEKDKEKDKEKNNEGGENKNTPDKNDEDKEKDKKKYNLDEVTEYQELMGKYATLQNDFSALQNQKTALEKEVSDLRIFKMNTERKDKQTMIDSFYMLSDEQKKDVIEKMDTYSLDDIEAKLSILCVRNKVNFSNNNSQETQNNDKPQGMFNLQSPDSNVPDWIKAVQANAQQD